MGAAAEGGTGAQPEVPAPSSPWGYFALAGVCRLENFLGFLAGGKLPGYGGRRQTAGQTRAQNRRAAAQAIESHKAAAGGHSGE